MQSQDGSFEPPLCRVCWLPANLGEGCPSFGGQLTVHCPSTKDVKPRRASWHCTKRNSLGLPAPAHARWHRACAQRRNARLRGIGLAARAIDGCAFSWQNERHCHTHRTLPWLPGQRRRLTLRSSRRAPACGLRARLSSNVRDF